MNNPNKTKTKIPMLKDLQLEIVSWDQVNKIVFDLAHSIKNGSFAPDIIIGVSRGGWVPARLLSDLLENPNLDTVTTKFYVGINQTKGEPTITQEVSSSVEGKKVLVVDDLVDSGKSLKLVISHLTNKGASVVKTATLYCKPWSLVVPDYCIEQIGAWVVFPWDEKENTRNLFEKYVTKENSIDAIKEKLINVGLNKKIINQIYEELH